MTGNLFSNLLSLHISPVPEEDFFTEVITWLLDKNPDILLSWLNMILTGERNYTNINVETQVVFAKLEDHLTGSRPDILISLFDEADVDYVLIESKIGSYEGYEQLPRYAEQLAEKFPNARNRYLVYITRAYDPKETAAITKKVKHHVMFKQIRWHEVYSFFKKQPPTILLDELLAFMRMKHMAEITRITPATLAAFSSFPDVFKFFQTILDGEVTDQVIKIFGKKPKSGADQFQYRRHVLHHRTSAFVFLVGFYMPESGEEFPKAAARFHVIPNQPMQKCIDLARVYKQIETDSANNPLCWKGHDLDQPKSWSYIELSCSFSEILHEEDHVTALRQRLLAYLGEAKRVLEQYPYILSSGTADTDDLENQTVNQ